MKSNGYQNEVILIRGLPGSGKSTLAKNMDGYFHFEADLYLEIDGRYVYDATKVRDAHDQCVASAKAALEQGKNIAVSNTFVKLWEMERYTDLGFPFRIIEMKNNWPNVHGVPEDRIEIMRKGFQQIPSHWRTVDASVFATHVQNRS